MELKLSSLEETRNLALRIAQALEPQDVIVFDGDLGAGKTTLIQGIIHGLGFKGRVQSPSFSLVRTYLLDLEVKHVDLYRLSSESIDDLHLEEIFNPLGVMLIEWGGKAEYLPGRISKVKIRIPSNKNHPDNRIITIHGFLERRLV